jgi:DNA polymerase-4
LIPCQDTQSILDAFAKLWRPPLGTPIRAGITLTRCVHDAYVPAPLFEGGRRRLALSRVMDRINLRYGLHAVYYGGMHGAKDAAPLRISFTTIPDPRMPW